MAGAPWHDIGNRNRLSVHRGTVTGDQRDFHGHGGLPGQIALFNSVLNCGSQLGLDELVDFVTEELLRSCRLMKTYGEWIYENDLAFRTDYDGIRQSLNQLPKSVLAFRYLL